MSSVLHVTPNEDVLWEANMRLSAVILSPCALAGWEQGRKPLVRPGRSLNI